MTGRRPAVLAEGDLRLDPASKRAWRGETELQLSPKEFSLLEFFLRHPGTVLTRSQIIEAVWDFAYDGTSNVVDQYVKYLRRKVDIPFGRRDIETVRGMGYRLRHQEPGRHVHQPPARRRLRRRRRDLVRAGELAVRDRAVILAARLDRLAARRAGSSTASRYLPAGAGSRRSAWRARSAAPAAR